MAHFAHYVSREVAQINYTDPNEPWFRENQPESQGFESPSYHVTRATSGPAARVVVGDIIWLFSELKTPWSAFPPSLDAKIVVAEARDLRAGRSGASPAFRFEAGDGSLWFPLYDATTTLEALVSVDSLGQCRPLLSPGQPPGRALRRMRQLFDPEPILTLARAVEQLGYDFVSYRLLDGTELACRKAAELIAQRRPVFWDRWGLPRRLAERRERVSDAVLDLHLKSRIAGSQAVWGISSPRYGESGSYSLKEKEAALNLGRFHPWPTE
jgi:hypothetical protein